MVYNKDYRPLIQHMMKHKTKHARQNPRPLSAGSAEILFDQTCDQGEIVLSRSKLNNQNRKSFQVSSLFSGGPH